jgi:hypothetical protein
MIRKSEQRFSQKIMLKQQATDKSDSTELNRIYRVGLKTLKETSP